ncbi:hypothetical protein C2S53_011985 [Perilla frutescens var. hirtella]|uniref:Zinc finger BED domain-containing protein RICESLEEPER 2-like n=1 Tax=Perilla frutescens var. hirtella TaxID=608512 RepID=A0AAD4IRK3_PERFH|nr:hypothetical protein C2S53_011985 [Perilla frutescens var. hirtella]
MADDSANSAPKEIKNTVEENIVEQPGNEIVVLGDDDTTNAKIIESLTVNEEGGKSSKKLTSDAWNHFKLISVKGVEKAKYNYYSALLSYKGRNETSHLLKHANLVCPRRHLRMGISQTQLNVKTEADGTTVVELKDREKPIKFDQDTSRKDLVNMVVVHEYPLSIVDHVGFRKFVKGLNSSFKMISRNTLKNDIMKTYDDAKSSLKALFNCIEGRVAITTDIWTTFNKKKIICL